jgi:hypothetical protein
MKTKEMPVIEQTKVCTVPLALQQCPTIKDGAVKKLVRKVIQKVKPLHCHVRWDSMKNMWCILDMKNPKAPEAIRHFETGIMRNVRFSVATVTSNSLCVYNQSIGIAEGDLIENSYGDDGLGFRNLGFNGAQFSDANGNKLEGASVLRLMDARTSLYKP